MKKFVVFAAVMIAVTGIAVASSLSVPFFLDNAPADGTFPPSAGNAAFIGIHNNTSSDIDVSIDYFDAGQDGTVDQQTPAVTSFVLPANSSFSFRPVADDPTTEVAAAVVPNMPGGEFAGSASLSWVGGPGDIQGRVVQINANGNQHSFLLPPGF